MPSFGISTMSAKNSSLLNMFPTSAIIFIKCRNRHYMKNNVRYKRYINNTSVINFFNEALAPFWWLFPLAKFTSLATFVNSTKLPAIAVCLGEPPVGFCDVGCCYCCCCCFPHWRILHFRATFLATGTPPWLLRPVKASTSSELYPGYFRLLYFCQAFPSQFYRECYGFEWAFFTHRHFLPYAPSPIFLAHFVTQLRAGCGQEHPIQDPPLCLPSQSCPFQLAHGLELLIL